VRQPAKAQFGEFAVAAIGARGALALFPLGRGDQFRAVLTLLSSEVRSFGAEYVGTALVGVSSMISIAIVPGVSVTAGVAMGARGDLSRCGRLCNDWFICRVRVHAGCRIETRRSTV
jgi:hypothetical protein